MPHHPIRVPTLARYDRGVAAAPRQIAGAPTSLFFPPTRMILPPIEPLTSTVPIDSTARGVPAGDRNGREARRGLAASAGILRVTPQRRRHRMEHAPG